VHHHHRVVDRDGDVFVGLTGQNMKPDGAQPLGAPRFFSSAACGGWTLVELVMVIAVGAILLFFMVRSFQPKDSLALEQAERLRNDLRHMQMLALTWGVALRLTRGTDASDPAKPIDFYLVSCVTAGAIPPCAGAPEPITGTIPVVDPATAGRFVVRLEPDLTLAGPGFTLDFDKLGRPTNGGALVAANATYTIGGASVPRTVVVAPITGFATAQ
jgi:type II secretory pathway pseudopilin PulG